MHTQPVLDANRSQTTQSSGSQRRAWGMTGLLLALTVINQADQAVFGIIAQPVAKELGLSSSQLGLVGSLFYAALSIGGLMAGVINRWISLKWALVILALIWSITALPLVVSASLATLIAFRLLLGLTEGPSVPLIFTAVYSWHPPVRRGVAGACLQASSAFTKFAVIPALAYVSVTWGWRTAILCIAVAAVLWCGIWVGGWSDGPHGHSKSSDSVESDMFPASIPWSKILWNRTFVFSSLLCMSAFALGATVLTWLPSYFEVGLGYSRLQAGMIFGLPALVGLVISLITSAVSDLLLRRGHSTRLARVILPATALVVSGIILATIPAIDTPAVAVAAVSVGYGFSMPCLPLIEAAMASICPPHQTAGTLGVLVAVFTIGGLVAPFATGVIVDAASTPAAGYASAFQIFGLVAIGAGVLASIMANPERDSPVKEPKYAVAQSE
ncbi:MFS transporter [Rhodococcus erythropolis]|uniref:MFS transporter n=1 Tax=Rhodococcus erythropolis TaxID=1833 RepID=UPI0003620BEB|nr:MFS transporter [Rhodococcus erythropolis]